jgi:hypothetical protein
MPKNRIPLSSDKPAKAKRTNGKKPTKKLPGKPSRGVRLS